MMEICHFTRLRNTIYELELGEISQFDLKEDFCSRSFLNIPH